MPGRLRPDAGHSPSGPSSSLPARPDRTFLTEARRPAKIREQSPRHAMAAAIPVTPPAVSIRISFSDVPRPGESSCKSSSAVATSSTRQGGIAQNFLCGVYARQVQSNRAPSRANSRKWAHFLTRACRRAKSFPDAFAAGDEGAMPPMTSCTPSVTAWLWAEDAAPSRRELEKIKHTVAADRRVSKTAAKMRGAAQPFRPLSVRPSARLKFLSSLFILLLYAKKKPGSIFLRIKKQIFFRFIHFFTRRETLPLFVSAKETKFRQNRAKFSPREHIQLQGIQLQGNLPFHARRSARRSVPQEASS